MHLLPILIEIPLNLCHQLPLFLIEHVKPPSLKPRFEIGDFELYISHTRPGRWGWGKENESVNNFSIDNMQKHTTHRREEERVNNKKNITEKGDVDSIITDLGYIPAINE